MERYPLQVLIPTTRLSTSGGSPTINEALTRRRNRLTHWLTIDNLVAVLRQTVTHLVFITIFRHGFGDAGVQPFAVVELAAVAHGYQSDDFAGNNVFAFFGFCPGAQCGLVEVVVPFGIDGALGNEFVFTVI